MKKAILGKKLGMTQIFKEDGELVPVTVIEAGPCVVIQVKNNEIDKYEAVKIGYSDIREKLVNKPIKGQYEKAEAPYKRYMREFRFENSSDYKVGDEIKVDAFEAGDIIDVSGNGKGKGFQGVIKRWNQSRGPMTHGSHYHRRPGSMGSSSSPSKVFKNKHLPGHMGAKKITVQNLEIVRVIAEKNLILVKGSVPGAKGNLLTVRDAVKQS